MKDAINIKIPTLIQVTIFFDQKGFGDKDAEAFFNEFSNRKWKGKRGILVKKLAGESIGLDVEKTKESGLSSKQIKIDDSLKSMVMEGRLRRFLQSARCTLVTQADFRKPSVVGSFGRIILRSRIIQLVI